MIWDELESALGSLDAAGLKRRRRTLNAGALPGHG